MLKIFEYDLYLFLQEGFIAEETPDAVPNGDVSEEQKMAEVIEGFLSFVLYELHVIGEFFFLFRKREKGTLA